MATSLRRGQALVETAVGMVAILLVVTMLCGFAVAIVKSLETQNKQRVGSSPAGQRQ